MSSDRKISYNSTLSNEQLVELRQKFLESSQKHFLQHFLFVPINEIVQLKNFQLLVYIVESKLWHATFQNNMLLQRSIETLVEDHENETQESIDNQLAIIEFLLNQGAHSPHIINFLEESLRSCYKYLINATITHPVNSSTQESLPAQSIEKKSCMTRFFNNFKNNFYSVFHSESAAILPNYERKEATQSLITEPKVTVTETKTEKITVTETKTEKVTVTQTKTEKDPETIKLIAKIKSAFQTAKERGSKAQRNQSITETFASLFYEKKLVDIISRYDDSTYKPIAPSSKGLFSNISHTDTKRVCSFLSSSDLSKVTQLSNSFYDEIIRDAPLKNILINGKIKIQRKYDKSYVEEKNFHDLLNWINRIRNKTNFADDLNNSIVINMCERIGLFRFLTQKSSALGSGSDFLAFLYYGCHQEYRTQGSITNFWRSSSNDAIFEVTWQFLNDMKSAAHTIQSITMILPAEEEIVEWNMLWEKEWKPYGEQFRNEEHEKLRPLRP